MNNIVILCDYKGYFGSKVTSKPYRSGMDKVILEKYFNESGISVEYLRFTEVNFQNSRGKIFLYTSSEDPNLFYKDYIEDIVYGLELAGALVIPSFKYLRATNNKVMMEIIRRIILPNVNNLNTNVYGCLEDLKNSFNKDNYYVFKAADGAQGRGVGKAAGQNLMKKVAIISATKNILQDFIDLARSLKYSGYIKNSRHRKKFVIQDYIDELTYDYKVLIFGNKYYVLKRYVRHNDFRASGSGIFEFVADVPEVILNFAEYIFNILKLPNLSLDIVVKSESCYLIEFQCVYFGSTTIEKSSFYFIRDFDKWVKIDSQSNIEQEYVRSILYYLRNYCNTKVNSNLNSV